MIAGVLLAAGESLRFGRPKLLEPWMGEPLISRLARAFLGGGLNPVLVVVPPLRDFSKALSALNVRLIENSNPELGIGHSIAIGIEGLPGTTLAALVGVADQPLLDEQVIRQLVEAFVKGSIVAPRYGGHLGSPCIFDRQFFAELTRLPGDVGGQAVVRAHPGAVVERPFLPRIGRDVDRPEDWDRLIGEEGEGKP